MKMLELGKTTTWGIMVGRISMFLIVAICTFGFFAADAQTASDEQFGEAFNKAWEEYYKAANEGRWSDAIEAGERAYALVKNNPDADDGAKAALAHGIARMHRERLERHKTVQWYGIAHDHYILAYGRGAKELYEISYEGLVASLLIKSHKEARYFFDHLEVAVVKHYPRPSREQGLMLLAKGDLLKFEYLHGLGLVPLADLEKKVVSTYRSGKKDFQRTGYTKGVGDAEFKIAEFYLDTDTNSKAARHFRSALMIYIEAGLPLNDPGILKTHTFLAVVYSRQGKNELATKHIEIVGLNQGFEHDRGLIPIYRVDPEYPEAALRRRIEGEVHVRFTIDATGSVIEPEIVRSEPPGVFDEAAIRAVLQWRYIPRSKDGVLVVAQTQILLTFKAPL